jgi:hypothetical protein
MHSASLASMIPKLISDIKAFASPLNVVTHSDMGHRLQRRHYVALTCEHRLSASSATFTLCGRFGGGGWQPRKSAPEKKPRCNLLTTYLTM